MVTLSVFLFSGQCIDRVMRLVVWGGWEDMRGVDS